MKLCTCQRLLQKARQQQLEFFIFQSNLLMPDPCPRIQLHKQEKLEPEEEEMSQEILHLQHQGMDLQEVLLVWVWSLLYVQVTFICTEPCDQEQQEQDWSLTQSKKKSSWSFRWRRQSLQEAEKVCEPVKKPTNGRVTGAAFLLPSLSNSLSHPNTYNHWHTQLQLIHQSNFYL